MSNIFTKNSLFAKISNKLNLNYFVFGSILIVCTSVVLYYSVHSVQKKQALGWLKILPSNLLTHLIDSDYFSLENKILLIKSTDLFSSFNLYDGEQNLIVGYGPSENLRKFDFIPIQDSGKQIWGYYKYQNNNESIMYTIIMVILFEVCLLILLLVIQSKYSTNLLLNEHSRFNRFIHDLAKFRKNLASITNLDDLNKLKFSLEKKYNQDESQLILANYESVITEIINLQNRIADYSKKEETTKAREEFTKIAIQVAHDIRAPIAALDAISQSLQTNDIKKKQIISNISNRISEISEFLLRQYKETKDTTEVNSLKITNPLNFTDSLVDINDIVNNIISEKMSLFKDVDIRLVPNHIENKFYIPFDIIQLKNILSNLLNNSYEAMKLNTSENFIEIECKKTPLKLIITIKDNGRGIPEHILASITETGFTFGKNNGNGLGLSYAKNLLDKHNGELKVTSKENIGTSVNIQIPLKQFNTHKTTEQKHIYDT